MVNIDKGRRKVISYQVLFFAFVFFPSFLLYQTFGRAILSKLQSIYQFIYWLASILVMTSYSNQPIFRQIRHFGYHKNSSSSSNSNGISITLNDISNDNCLWLSAIDNPRQYNTTGIYETFIFCLNFSLKQMWQQYTRTEKSKKYGVFVCVGRKKKIMFCLENKAEKRHEVRKRILGKHNKWEWFAFSWHSKYLPRVLHL